MNVNVWGEIFQADFTMNFTYTQQIEWCGIVNRIGEAQKKTKQSEEKDAETGTWHRVKNVF